MHNIHRIILFIEMYRILIFGERSDDGKTYLPSFLFWVMLAVDNRSFPCCYQ